MNTNDLRYLVAVAEEGSFNTAAKKCHVSQPTLSGQIKKLETQLGIQIFERSNKHVLITEVGHQIIKQAKIILNEVDTIYTIANISHNPLGGPFSLGAFPTLAPFLFPSLIPNLTETLPRLKLTLMEEKTHILIDALKDGSLDAAFLALPIDDKQLEARHMFDDEFSLAVSTKHPLAKHSSVSMTTLRQHQLLLLEDGHCLREQALDICTATNIPVDHNYRASSIETLREMVRANSGITLIPNMAIRSHNHDKGIRYIPIAEPTPYRSIAIVFRKTSVKINVIESIIKTLSSGSNTEKTLSKPKK